MISLVTSFVGAGPLGGVIVGSVASGPLVGVVPVVGSLVFSTTAFAAVDSLPTPIVLEPLEPQPAISAAAPMVAVARPRRAGRSRRPRAPKRGARRGRVSLE